jgi:hypothetical protein
VLAAPGQWLGLWRGYTPGVFSDFLRVMSRPAQGTGLAPSALDLDGLPFLADFAVHVGTGVFLGGMLSVCSVREADADLAPWSALVPPGARLFATNGIGELFFVVPGGELYLVMVHEGDSTDLAVAPEAFFEQLWWPTKQSLWLSMDTFGLEPRTLAPTQVLTYDPPLATGRNTGVDLVPCEQPKNLAALAALHFNKG